MACDENSDNDDGNPRQSNVAFPQRFGTRPSCAPGVATQLIGRGAGPRRRLARSTDRRAAYAQAAIVAQGAVDETVEDCQHHGRHNQVQREVDKVHIYLGKVYNFSRHYLKISTNKITKNIVHNVHIVTVSLQIFF